MSEDPVDELGARLFEAARQELPPSAAPERAIKAMRRELSKSQGATGLARPWMFVLPLAGALAVIAVWRTRHAEPVSPISAEPSGTFSAARHDPPRESSRLVVAPSASAPTVAVPSAPTSRAAAPARSAPVTLADELSQLKRVENALGAGDVKQALAELDRYDRASKGQRMRAEATLLRIEALSRAGRAEAAAALAQRFVEQNPESPLVDRARSFVAKDPSAAGGQRQQEKGVGHDTQ